MNNPLETISDCACNCGCINKVINPSSQHPLCNLCKRGEHTRTKERLKD